MKARLKTVLFAALGSIAAFSAVTYTSCNNDKCDAVVCAYGGVCDGGSCICPTGYEGNQCETITREKFKGIWYVTEDGTLSNTTQYAVSLELGGGINEIKITNFRNFFTTPVNGFVKNDTLYIPQQTVQNNEVQGIGYLQDDKFYGVHGKLTLRYNVKDLGTGLVDEFGLNLGDPSIWNK